MDALLLGGFLVGTNIRHSVPAYSPPWSIGNKRSVFSPKIARAVTLYSDLEFDHYILVEADPTVTFFCEQPCHATASVEGQQVSAVLDMWLLFKDGHEEYREIKQEETVRDLDQKARAWRQMEAERRWCELNGFRFSVQTEQQIYAKPVFLSNWKRILPYLADVSGVRKSGLDIDLLQHLKSTGQDTFRRCEQRFCSMEPSTVHRAAFLLLHRGDITADLVSSPLGRDTILTPSIQ